MDLVMEVLSSLVGFGLLVAGFMPVALITINARTGGDWIGEVENWLGWRRWTALTVAVLTVIRLVERKQLSVVELVELGLYAVFTFVIMPLVVRAACSSSRLYHGQALR
jgi:hypothetical protein